MNCVYPLMSATKSTAGVGCSFMLNNPSQTGPGAQAGYRLTFRRVDRSVLDPKIIGVDRN